MNRIARYITLLEVVSVVGMCIMIAMKGFTWIGGSGMGNYDAHVAGLLVSYNPVQAHSAEYVVVDHVATMPFAHRMLGLLVDLVSLAIMAYGVVCFIRLVRSFRAGVFFSATSMAMLKKLTVVAFAWALYNPVRYMLLSVITTWHNKPGERVLSLGVGSSDIINIVIFGSFVVIMALMQEGYKLQQERDLTI